MGCRISLLGVNEAREEDGIPNKEDGGVVANQIPVTFFCVELDSKTTRVPDGISRAAFTSNSREADSNRGFLPNI